MIHSFDAPRNGGYSAKLLDFMGPMGPMKSGFSIRRRFKDFRRFSSCRAYFGADGADPCKTSAPRQSPSRSLSSRFGADGVDNSLITSVKIDFIEILYARASLYIYTCVKIRGFSAPIGPKAREACPRAGLMWGRPMAPSRPHRPHQARWAA